VSCFEVESCLGVDNLTSADFDADSSKKGVLILVVVDKESTLCHAH
jgi:hypothetical protein